MIYILLYIIGCLSIKLLKVIEQRDTYYSNYQNCLLVLQEYDPELKKYMKGKDNDV